MALQQIRDLLAPDASLAEEVLERTTRWQGRIFQVQTLGVATPNGASAYREVALHHGGAGVCALREGRICLVRQWRVALGQMTLEIPAGKIDAGEDPAACAARELTEETGLVAGKLTFLARAAGSVGFTNEATAIYLAEDLRAGSSCPDAGEFVDVAWLPVDDVLEAVEAGLIQDAKTIIAAQAARLRGLA